MFWGVVFYIILILLIAVLVAFIISTYLVSRMRALYKREGAFICSYRPDLGSGWTEGYAEMSKDTLNWYRGIAFTKKPHKDWSREKLEIIDFQSFRGRDGVGSLRVLLQCDQHRFYLFMQEEFHSALVAWLEATPPRPPQASDWGYYQRSS